MLSSKELSKLTLESIESQDQIQELADTIFNIDNNIPGCLVSEEEVNACLFRLGIADENGIFYCESQLKGKALKGFKNLVALID